MSRLHPADPALATLADWRMLFAALHARFRFRDYATGLSLLAAIGAAAEQADHHPDLDLRYRHLNVRLTSHDVGAVTGRDVRLARTISALAAERGATAEPHAVQVLELALDSPERASVLPFWKALLAMRETPGVPAELTDPDGTLPTVWLQPSGAQPLRQRWHLDLRVPPESVQPRIDAALAAGGRLVDDRGAPAFWVLADPDGNRACLTTWQGRD